MDELDQAISRLKAKRAALAESGLQQPQGRDAFEYGRVVGTFGGLTVAITTIEEVLDEQAKEEAGA